MLSRVAALALSVLVLLGLAAPPAAASATPVKVVIVVGPTGSATSSYRGYGDQAAAEAAQAMPGANVVKVYSPDATWDAVRDALQGASYVIYLGHGNGFPSPYRSAIWVYSQDGFGLNAAAGQGDSNTAYYGEYYIARDVQLAPNAVVILSHLCYASGNSEPQDPVPTLVVAKQRIDNYAAGFFAAGAGAVIAEAFGDPGAYFLPLSQPGRSVEQIWGSREAGPSWTRPAGSPQSFASDRSPGHVAWYDPSDPTTDAGIYHRSMVVVPGLSTSTIGVLPGSVGRMAGVDRYATAAAISAATYSPGAPVAYIATGVDFPDALAAAAAAGNAGGPVLLATATSLPGPTAAELTRLKPGRIVVVGGPSVVSDAVAAALAGFTTGGVTRLSGADRYATAAAISASTFAEGVPVAYIATGTGFPDALAGAAAGGMAGGPVLLVPRDAVPAATANELKRLKPGRIVVLGGPSVVSDAVATDLAAFTSGGVTRLAGADRYATAAAISTATFAPGVPVAYVATGLDFPDALAGAAAAGMVDAPVLLVPGGSIPASTSAELARLKPARIVVLGSSGVVSWAVEVALGSYAP